jgi:peroxiredoxin family protein
MSDHDDELEPIKKVSIIVSKGSLEGIYPALIMANGARAEGIEVNLFFTFFGMDAVHRKRIEHIKVATVGNPGMHIPTLLGGLPGMSALATHFMAKKMEEIDIPSIPEFIEMISCAASTSPSAPARSTPSWAPTARASPRSPAPCSAAPSTRSPSGTIRFKGDDITDWPTDVRAKAGMFLAFQYPQEIPGVSVIQFLRQALSARKGIDLSVLELRLAIMEWMERLGMDPPSPTATSTRASRAARRSATRSCRWRSSSPSSPSSTRPTPASTSTPCASWPGVREVRADRPELGVC